MIESPFKNKDIKKFNANYIYLCLVARKVILDDKDSPLFFHGLYTQFLNDNDETERNTGIITSFNWHSPSDFKLYAIDRGISKGMIMGAEDALEKNIPIKFFTAMPEEHWISKRVAEINLIIDMKERWMTGLAFVEKMQSDKIIKELFEEDGELTGYVIHNDVEINKIKDCLFNFFSPLIEYIKE